MTNSFRVRGFKERFTEQWDRAGSRLRVFIVILTLLVPPVAWMVETYETLVTRYVMRHVVLSGTPASGLPAGQIVAAIGQVHAKPVQLPDGYPQFQNALMIVELHERYKHGRRGGWRTARRFVWTSDGATFGAWQLDPQLIEHARFIWHRALPCTQYNPPAGWVADCKTGYAYRQGNDDIRLSYQITPIPTEMMTMVAAVSGGKLTTIEHHLSAPPANFAIWTDGAPDVRTWLDQRVRRELGWSVLWAVLSLAVVWWYMSAALRREGNRPRLASLTGGFWRAVVTLAPLAGVVWPFDGPGFIAAAFLGAFFSAVVGLGLWFSVGTR